EDVPAPPSGEIFVFTPTGELRMLSAGSSVLDFAFNIHSNVGARCSGGKVNGRPVPIREKLKTGDVVEILTSRNQRPGKDWLNWVVSAKARNKIRQELDIEERKAAADGREILSRRLKNWKLEMPDDVLFEYMKSRKYTSVLPFMAAIAREELDVNEIKTFLLHREEQMAARLEALSEVEKVSRNNTDQYAGNGDDILVINAKNVKGLEYKMAKCCNPVFGDDVFGFVTRDQGITIHRNNCPNAPRLKEKYGYRVQKVVWAETPTAGTFPVLLKIEASLDHAVLAQVMDVIGKFKASIRSFNVAERERNHAQEYLITTRIQVPSNLEYDKIVSQLQRIPKVSKVYRG
ncbi:MAG: bifunctional (p)ppGpp synthetase/guanosine-3',5'-bis(diphosphate) 3'-pyrophosphohydrolase, partial [Bacteroidales bacterium]|nr:bifunctional (p)ppGpp synthetase/guanosine-3',5'-bis(diphosphate) 3'-pyrophosphohydrolase [Candidatus Cryptobacteroides choladohippi]